MYLLVSLVFSDCGDRFDGLSSVDSSSLSSESLPWLIDSPVGCLDGVLCCEPDVVLYHVLVGVLNSRSPLKVSSDCSGRFSLIEFGGRTCGDSSCVLSVSLPLLVDSPVGCLDGVCMH